MRVQQRKAMISIMLAMLLAIGALLPAPRVMAAETGTLTLSQHALGNIFFENETVIILAESDAETVNWVVRDFWGNTAASGSTPVNAAGTTLIEPAPAGAIGYYEMDLTAVVGADVVASAKTTFGVIRHTETDADDTRFGVMTHFAQNWDVDVMPLINKAGIRHVRDEHYWGSVEQTKGVYNFEDVTGGYMQTAKMNDLQVLPIMSFANKLYDTDPNGNQQAWTIRRWVSNLEGQVNITGYWKLSQTQGTGTDGTGFRIFVDGQEIFDDYKSAQSSTTISLNQINVVEGTVIDFVVTPGNQDAVNSWFDGTRFAIDIWKVGGGVSFHSESQFSGVQGGDQWHYGYASMPSVRWDDYEHSTDFREMTYNSTTQAWKSSAFQWAGQKAGTMSPDIKATSGVSPYTEDGREGYANYGKAMLDYYTAMEAGIPAIEVWNEYNGSFSNGPATADKPFYYTEMLKKTYEVLKSAYPDVPVIGTASVMIPTGYLEALFELGALDYMDGVVIHPYVQNWNVRWPELVWTEINDLNEQIKRFNNGETKPIWVTEFGFSSQDRKYTANFNARQMALMSSFDNVERSYTYLLRDDASFPYMGLLKSDQAPEGKYTPNPAYVATANMVHQLNGATALGREFVDSLSNLYIMKFTDSDEDELRIAWSADDEGEIGEFYTNEPLTIVDMMGVETVAQPVNGKVSIPLGESIVFVKGNVQSIQGTAGQPVADSFLSFTGEQGENGWQYGYYDEDVFQPMHYTPEFTWNWQWQGGADETLKVTQPGGYPSRVTADTPAVRRWTSSVEGEVNVQGLIGPSELNYSIRVDGTTVFDQTLQAVQYDSYDATFTVEEGSFVDFVIQHPNGQINLKSDKTVFTARIYDTTESASPGEAAPALTLTGSDEAMAGEGLQLDVGLEGVQSPFKLLSVVIQVDPTKLVFALAGEEGSESLDEAAIQLLHPDLSLLGSSVKPDTGEILLILAVAGQDATEEDGALFQLIGQVKEEASLGETAIFLTDAEASINGEEVPIGVPQTPYELAVVDSIVPGDRTSLDAVIAEALALHGRTMEGVKLGQYAEGSRSGLQTAIVSAQASGNSQSAIDQAKMELETALQQFRLQLVTMKPGATRITIHDLSLIANYYNAAPGEAGWSEVEKADVLNLNIIDIRNLAAVAQMILNEWRAD
ncbi:hypothetical protein IDH44_09780 [Paenibacillus sp. IB182496]|uniref:Asl1-like glycosyl hydrolase catalytic domain-containing protein n=1 Tax=Paenibacillus sabuli TaxID=2772509 RepID=A0A927GS95_9BACL|nr:glycosyl hydrolase [Paenibacillus sabuli]MBD2845477.1 hypothetical protein [Paenibacillus sabuli]